MSYVAVSPGDAPPAGLAGLGALQLPLTAPAKTPVDFRRRVPVEAPTSAPAPTPAPTSPALAPKSKTPMIVAGVAVAAAVAAFVFLRRK